MPRTLAVQTTALLSAPLRTLPMAGLAIALSLAASAQSTDVKYCQALLTKYDTFIVKPSGHAPRRGDNAAEVAASKCREGDPAGIPGLERALQDAKIELPPRIQEYRGQSVRRSVAVSERNALSPLGQLRYQKARPAPAAAPIRQQTPMQ